MKAINLKLKELFKSTSSVEANFNNMPILFNQIHENTRLYKALHKRIA
jgi:hypothetical protein